jgi:PAS domain S-box-containing protein
MGTSVIAVLSVGLLIGAAVILVALVRMTGKRWVWGLFGAAVLVLTVARVVAIARGSLDPMTEAIYLLISILLLVSFYLVRRLGRDFHSSIARLKSAQNELDTVRERLGHVLSGAPIVAFSVDKDGIFTMSEGKGLEALGLKPGEVVGRSVFELYKDYPDIIACIRRGLAGEDVTASTDVVDLTFETHYTPMRDDKGDVVGVFGVAADVSRRKRSETQLRATKERFRTLVETTSDWVWEVDSDAVYTYASPKVKDLLGYEPDELIGKTPFETMPPEEAARTGKEFRRYAAERVPFQGMVNVCLHKDGRKIVLETSGVPVFNADGHLIGYRGIDRDITARTMAEEALRASESRLNLALVGANMGTWDWDIQTNRVTWSAKVEELFGMEKGAFDGSYETYVGLIHPEDRDNVQFAINAALEGKISPYRVRHRSIKPDGEIRWLEGIGQVIRDDAGTPERMIGVITDVTDRELANMQLRREKEAAQMYLDIVGTIVVALNKDGAVQLINGKGCEILGYEEQEIIGKDWFENFLPESIREEVGAAFQRILAGELEPLEYYENPVLTRSGEERLIAWHNTVIRDDDGELVGTLSSGGDITDKRHAEQMKQELEDQLRHSQRMETIGTLAGGIAHDFNNILSPILGYVDMAMDDVAEDSSVYDYLEQVIKATRRAKELVEQILLFSKNADRDATPIHIHLIIREALKLVRASLPTTIEIQQNINTDAGIVVANAAQIHQVLVNLCANAAHAMRDIGGILRVSLEPVDVDETQAEEHTGLQPGSFARLTVSDTGRGMDEQTLSRVFEPFFTTKDVGEGTGLGLSVVHGIVTSHNGEITLDSVPGEGTAATVYFPHSEKLLESDEEETLTDVEGTEHVLFVDDEPDILDLGRRMLERLGYRVTTAANGDEALRFITANPTAFDIVVSDQTMPRKTGLILAEEIRWIRRDIPVILMTGFSDKITPERLAELDVSSLVMKPLMGRKLGGTIRQVLDG